MHRTIPSPGVTQVEAASRQRLALITLCLAQFGIVLAFQGAAIVLPEVEQGLGRSASSSLWLVSANAVASGGLLLAAGRAADLFGHRRLFVAGTILFGLASLLAGLAPTFGWLIAGRVLQGVGTAMFVPATFALLADIFPDGPERRRALAAWGTAGPLGGVIAILAGGALAGMIGWRAMFVLGAVLAVPVVVLALNVLPDRRVPTPGSLEPLATLTGVVGIGAVVGGLAAVANDGAVTTVALGWGLVGLVLLGICFWSERRAVAPLIPHSLRRRWAIWQPIAVSFFHGAAINTPIVFYGMFMQQFRDASPWEIGLGFLPCNLTIIVGSAGSSRLAKQVGYRLVMVSGMVLVGIGLVLLMTISADRSYLVSILPGWLVFGLGVGISQVGIVGTATERAPESERGVVGGLVGTMAQVGTAVGLALLVIASERFANDIDGYRAAFASGAVLALVGLGLALVPSGAMGPEKA